MVQANYPWYSGVPVLHGEFKANIRILSIPSPKTMKKGWRQGKRAHLRKALCSMFGPSGKEDKGHTCHQKGPEQNILVKNLTSFSL